MRRGMSDAKVAPTNGPRPLGLLNRIPTWKMTGYSQVAKGGVQAQSVGVRDRGADEDFDPLVRDIGAEGDDETDLEPAHHTVSLQRGIAMQVFNPAPPQKNASTMYEPFRES